MLRYSSGMPKVLDITLLGDPCLLVRSEPILDVKNADIQELIDDLIETMLHSGAVGLAAPQVSRGQRVFVMQSRPSERYPNAPEIAPFGLINPELISVDAQTVAGWEGCYSMPGYGAVVRRPSSIVGRWLDRNGQAVERELSGLQARVFLHELDHLDGIMFFERLDSIRELVSVKERDRVLKTL
jgi:peptide deformylase